MNDSVFAKAAPDYQLIEEIGEGAYSHVFYAKHKKLNFEAALKFCEIESFIKREELEYLKREIAISRAMNHPFIADLYDILKTDEFVIFVFEYIPGGNLLEFLNKIEINESLSRCLFFQLISVFYYLHTTMKIAHRDIKAENIMLDRYRNIRVIDFGFSKGINSESLLTTACGSAAYIAPEVFTQETYTEKADIWSLGVVLFALNANHLPFDSSNAKKVRHMIMHMEPEYPSTFSPALVDLLKKMLLKDPEKRITIDEIVNHQWMLVPSPNGLMRYSLTYTKDHVLNYKNMDEGILNYMEFVGVDTKNLAEKLKTNVRDHVTSSYRALFRQKHAQMLSNYYTAALVPIQPNKPKPGPNITVIKLPTKLSNDNLPSANSLFDSPINSPTCSPPLSPINYGLLRSPQTKRTLQLASSHQQQFQIMQQQNQQQQQQRQQFRQPTMASSFLKIPQCLNRNQVSIKHNQESFSDDESMPSTMRLKPGVLIASPLRNTRYSTNRVLNSFYGPK